MLKGKRILITAGPTKEFIDPVRFISNASSGKMGYAIAEELYSKGAEVILITGPTNIRCNLPDTKVVHVTTALEMLKACRHYFGSVDIAIFTAAVADYRPLNRELSKIKKNDDTMVVELTKNPDIAFEFGKVKDPHQLSIGFALETDNIIEYGKGKMNKKKFDFIVLNTTNENGEGFGFDTNKISILFRDHAVKSFPLKSKKEVAKDIISELESQIKNIEVH
ncbi:MAG: phosphopantothenoylcysteine decarboxylase [Bacteroidota bacterium]|nr:phosphopantothenoylcysteine decarboxylase [Bacteroidota bacterium]